VRLEVELIYGFLAEWITTLPSQSSCVPPSTISHSRPANRPTNVAIPCEPAYIGETRVQTWPRVRYVPKCLILMLLIRERGTR
jgi:hypothetical protein